MAQVDTVRIQHPGFPDGYVIDAADFDPEVHTRFGEKPPAAPARGGRKPAPDPAA